MAVEIERKFLVASDEWRAHATGSTVIRQGYLTRGGAASVRVRRTGAGAWLTVKSGSNPLGRLELEYPIPPDDADALLELCAKPIIEKERHLVPGTDGLLWEVDEFQGALAGLTLAEVELPAPDSPLAIPPWTGPEVTHDPSYLNSNLHRLGAPGDCHQ